MDAFSRGLRLFAGFNHCGGGVRRGCAFIFHREDEIEVANPQVFVRGRSTWVANQPPVGSKNKQGAITENATRVQLGVLASIAKKSIHLFELRSFPVNNH